MLFLKKHRKSTSLVILVSAIIASFFIVRGEQKQTPDYLFQIVQNVNTGVSSRTFDGSLPNLTNEFADQSLKILVEKNSDMISGTSKDSKNIKTLPEKNDVNKIISQIIDKNTDSEKIDVSEIRINQKNTKEIQLAYLLSIDYILKDPKDFPIPADNSIIEIFRSTSVGFKKKADLLKVIYVPPSWVGIHQQILQFLTDQKNIYTSLASGESDPLRFIVATKQILLTETDQQIENIKGAIRQKAKDEKII